MSYPEFLDPIEGASREVLDAHQEAAIGAITRYAYEHAPLIRQQWDAIGLTPSAIKSRADFVAKAPLIEKDDIRRYRDAHNDPTGGMGRLRPGETVSIATTSGTTGDPTPVPGWAELPIDISYARDIWHMGVRPGDYITYMLFTFRGGHRRRTYAPLDIAEIHFSISPEETARAVEASLRFRPTIWQLCSTPVLLMLEAYFEKSGVDPRDVFSSYKGAIFGGEPLSARLAALTASWGLELFETTSLGDVAGATECRMHNGFHAFEDLSFLECVDPTTREPVADGEIGELVVTTLVDRMTPLIRYATGDLATIDRVGCGCGRNHARFRVLGRATDQILINGRSILPREIMGLVEVHSETRGGLFQIVRTDREMAELRLRVGFDNARLASGEDALRLRLHDQISSALGVPVAIQLVDEQELLKLGPPHKIPRVTKE